MASLKVGSSTQGNVGRDKVGQAETVATVVAGPMQAIMQGIGDTGAHAPQMPQTLHTISEGICA